MITLLLWLYGATMLAAACNAPAWWRLAVLSFFEPKIMRSIRITRISLAAMNTGMIIGNLGRVGTALSRPQVLLVPIPIPIPWTFRLGVDGLSVSTWDAPSWVVVVWMLTLLVGEVGMLLGSYFALRDRGRRAHHFPVFIFLVLVWTLAVFVGGLK